MDQPLGTRSATRLSCARLLRCRGEGPPTSRSSCSTACSRLLALSDLGVDEAEGRRRAEATLADGTAVAAYERWIRAQGGDPSEDAAAARRCDRAGRGAARGLRDAPRRHRRRLGGVLISKRRTSSSRAATTRPPRMPPPWFVHLAWRAHRALYRLSGGRFLWSTSNKRGWGALRLTTVGRKSGRERSVILGYLEEKPLLFTLAMNGWDDRGSGVVAQPPATSRRRREAGRPGPDAGARAPRRGRRARSTVAAMGRGRSEHGPLREPSVDRNPCRRARACRRDQLRPRRCSRVRGSTSARSCVSARFD